MLIDVTNSKKVLVRDIEKFEKFFPTQDYDDLAKTMEEEEKLINSNLSYMIIFLEEDGNRHQLKAKTNKGSNFHEYIIYNDYDESNKVIGLKNIDYDFIACNTIDTV